MSATTQVAVYAGSFDPPTFGHLDLVDRASKLFPRVVVAIGVHPARVPLFSVEERLALMQEICAPYSNVEVASFRGLLVDYGKSIGARVVVRGLRAGTDFEYELQIAHGFISATLVREIASHGGDVSRYAPGVVCEALQRKFGA
jgi:pantetheine-phosphate adenylyltransferase